MARLHGARERLPGADRQVDIALALGAGLFGAAYGVLPDPEVAYDLAVGPLPGALGAVAGVALLWRRRHAVVVFLVVAGLGSLAAVMHWQSGIPVALLLASYALGAFASPRAGRLAVTAALLALAVLFLLRAPYFDTPVGLFNIGQVLVAWLVGLGVAHHRRLAALARERVRSLSHRAADDAERAVVAERLRLARLLHARVSTALDEVADTACRARAGNSELPQSLSRIEDSTRQAAQDLRHLLGTLRAPDPVPVRQQHRPARWPIDVAVGMAVVVFNVGGTLLPDPSSAVTHADPVWSVLIALSVLPGAALLFRRHAPVSVLAVVFTVVVAVLWLRWPEGTIPAGLVIACYAVGAWAPPRRALAALIGVNAVIVVVGLVGPPHLSPDWRMAVVVTAPWAIGTAVRHRRLRDQADLSALHATQDLHALRLRRAVLEERLSVARDLHDVVSHNLSGIVIQAAAARRSASTGAETEVLEALERAARTALSDLQEMVLALQAPATRQPSPGVGGLESLVARHRRDHGPASLVVDRTVTQEPESVQLAAYRVVQEALANSAKHAPGAAVSVRVVHEAAQVRVEVTNAAAAPGDQVVGTGVGLTGLAERVALHGGTFEAGPDAHGGFGVCARLPSHLVVAS